MFEQIQINIETDLNEKLGVVEERLDQFQQRINEIPDLIDNQQRQEMNQENNGIINSEFQQKLMELN